MTDLAEADPLQKKLTPEKEAELKLYSEAQAALQKRLKAYFARLRTVYSTNEPRIEPYPEDGSVPENMRTAEAMRTRLNQVMQELSEVNWKFHYKGQLKIKSVIAHLLRNGITPNWNEILTVNSLFVEGNCPRGKWSGDLGNTFSSESGRFELQQETSDQTEPIGVLTYFAPLKESPADATKPRDGELTFYDENCTIIVPSPYIPE